MTMISKSAPPSVFVSALFFTKIAVVVLVRNKIIVGADCCKSAPNLPSVRKAPPIATRPKLTGWLACLDLRKPHTSGILSHLIASLDPPRLTPLSTLSTHGVCLRFGRPVFFRILFFSHRV